MMPYVILFLGVCAIVTADNMFANWLKSRRNEAADSLIGRMSDRITALERRVLDDGR
jgi:hypothetical protein